MVGRDVVLMHAEAVAAFCVHVELDGFFCFAPFFVERNTIGREAELIIRGSGNKHRWGVGGNGGVFQTAGGGVDRSDERGLAVWRVAEGDSGGDGSSGGETDDADAVGGNVPLGSVLANVSDGCESVGNGQRNNLTDGLVELLAVADQSCELLGGVFASVGEAVFQDEGGYAFCGEILCDICAFAGDGEGREAAAGRDDNGSAVCGALSGLEDGEGRLRHIGDDFGVPIL